MQCPHCGQEHPDSTRFCTITGKTINQPMIICPKCGRELPAGIIFCTSCGKHLDPDLTPVEYTPPQKKSKESKISCPNCETNLPEGTKFCTVCGHPLTSQAAPPPVPLSHEGTITCPYCSTELPKGTKFCTTCGQIIDAEAAPPTSSESSGETITCPHCDAILPGGTKTCTSCGRDIISKTKREKSDKRKKIPLPESEEQQGEKIICPQCAAQLPLGSKFCIVCGTKLESSAVETDQLKASTPADTPLEQESKMIHCPHCSAQLSASARFCTTCGMFLTDEVIPSQMQTQKNSERSATGESDFAISEPLPPTIETIHPSMVPAVYTPLAVSEQEIACPYCKYILPADTIICPSCATVLKTDIDISSLSFKEDENIICPYCELYQPASNEVCPSCGTNMRTGKPTRIRHGDPTAITVCEYCSLVSKNDADWCISCGAPLNPPPQQEIIATKPVDMKQCIECGSPIPSGMAFCPDCGAAVADKTEKKPGATAEEQPTAFCTECGAAIPSGMAFCPDCGAAAADKTEKKPGATAEEQPTAFCTECGSPIPSGMAFCPDCGANTADKTEEKPALPTEEQPSPFCTECGAAIPSGMMFCPNCGANTADKTEEKPALPTEEQPTAFCTECGAVIPSGMAFCPDCGASTADRTEEKPALPTEEQPTAFCTECGAAIPSGMAFCPDCGAAAADKTEEKPDATAEERPTDFCTECGAAIPPGMAFYPDCGAAAADKTEEKPGATAEERPTAFCTECGSLIPSGMAFCPNCGNTVAGLTDEIQGEPPAKVSGEILACPNCSAEVPIEMEFCPTCGASMLIKPILPEENTAEDEDKVLAANNNRAKAEEKSMDREEESISPPSKPAHPCPNCGAALPLATKVCETCGASVFTEPTKQLCQNCWQEIPSGVAFCINCGMPIPTPEGITPPPVIPQEDEKDHAEMALETSPVAVKSTPSVPITEILFERDISRSAGARTKKRETCPRCGIVLTPDTKFCASCGMPMVPGLDESSADEPSTDHEACPFCGIVIPKGKLVCPSCGNPLEANIGIERTDGNGAPLTGRCPFCGLKIPASAKTCPSCTAVISSTTPKPDDQTSSQPPAEVISRPTPVTAPPSRDKKISPLPESKSESDKPRPFLGPSPGASKKPPVNSGEKNAQPLTDKIKKYIEHKPKRMTIIAIAGIILIAAAAFTAFRLLTPYQPKSLDAQLTQIAKTAQPIATLPAALAMADTPTQAAAELVEATPTVKAKKTKAATPTPELEFSPTPQITADCTNPDENGVCPPSLDDSQASTPESPSASSGTPIQNSTVNAAAGLTTPMPIAGNPTSQPNTTPNTSSALILPTVPSNLPTQTNPGDGAVLVQIPSGGFIMGSDAKSDPDYWGVEGPMRTVQLERYWIYQNEVTNAMYQKCVEAGNCTKPSKADTKSSFYAKAQYADYPIVQVNWEQADAYCKWAGGNLPTEAQWEKAARGTDGRRFPWGNIQPDGKKLNMCDKKCSLKEKDNKSDDGFMNLAPVGSFPDGMSPYGLLDMAGNVWEWTADWYQASYYKTAPTDNPTGPTDGTGRTIRGGSWSDKLPAQFRTVTRQGISPVSVFDTLGFRCIVP